MKKIVATRETNGILQQRHISVSSEATPTANMWLFVEDGIVRKVNPDASMWFEQSSSELIGKPFLSLIYPADSLRLTLSFREYLQRAGDEMTQRIRLFIYEHETISVDLHVRVINIDSPTVYSITITPAIVASPLDVPLSTTQALYHSVLELSPYGVIVVDNQGIVRSTNPAFAKLTGYPLDAIQDKHIAKLPTIRLRDIPSYLALFRKLLLSNAQNDEIEFRWKHRDGSLRWGLAYASVVRVDGHTQGLLAILRDITETKRHETLLTAMNQAATAMLNALDPETIYEEVSRVFTDLDFKFTVLSSDAQHQYVTPRYFNFASHALEAVERTLSTRILDLRFPIERVKAFQEVIWHQRPVYIQNMEEEIMRLLESMGLAFSPRFVHLLGIPKSINAPITLEDGSSGFLSIQSDDLRPEDIPTFTALANQMSAALRQAQLYEQANTELAIRKQAETEIDRLQVLLHSISISMPSMLIAADQNGVVYLWNAAIETATHIPAGDALGKPFWDVAPYLALSRGVFDEVISTQKAIRGRRLSSGTTGRYYSIQGFPFSTGELSGVVLYIDDVTDLVAMENTMHQNAKMASVGSLAAGVAHEINNPLTAIMQATQLVQRALDTTQASTRQRMAKVGLDADMLDKYMASRDIADYLEGIRTSGVRAAKIVADLLSFSRKRSFNLAKHALNDVVCQALELVSKPNGDSRIYRSTIIHFDLAEESPVLFCDAQQIQQVVMNISRNAFQAMQAYLEQCPTYLPELLIRTRTMDGEAQIIIQDNGPGMTDEVRTHLFEPFFTTKDVGEGTGLGLWLCWSIVTEHHQGTIYVDAEYIDGTRFVISLPLIPPQP